jgi:hypothetical protein
MSGLEHAHWAISRYLQLFLLVIPAKAGIQRLPSGQKELDPGFRRDDGLKSADD